MHYLVYRTINTVNGKYYTGAHETDNLNDGYLGSGKYLKRAIKKYGADKFIRTILHEAQSREEMYAKEKSLVDFGPQSYNIHEGGKGGWQYINAHKLGAHDRKNSHLRSVWGRLGGLKSGRLAVELKVGIHDPKYKKLKGVWCKIGTAFKGKHHTNETKRKIGLANSKRKGKQHHWFGVMWIHNPSTQENTRIKNTDIIPNGWIKGRK